MMKNDQLKNYVQVYKNVVDKEILEGTVNQLKEKNFDLHAFYNDASKQYYHNEKELSSYYRDDILTNRALMQYTWEAIQFYVGNLNFAWWTGWAGHTPLKYNKYAPGTKMTEHCDHIKDIFDGERKGAPILTVLTLLNDDFKGGEFVMFKDEEYKLNAGDIIVFPSNFLYPHRVNEVTEGVRYSCVSWVW